jgi:MOSC domain-containing protein
MARQLIGKVAALWRYPVKSMLGEKLDEASVGLRGIVGDRAFALREAETGRVLSAKKYPKLFTMSAGYESSPEGEAPAPVRITLPDGKIIHPDDPDASQTLSAILGRAVRIEWAERGQTYLAAIDAATVFGGIPTSQIFPELKTTTLPDFFPLPEGTFFDSAPIHVLASATLKHLSRIAGGDSRFDQRRFRPNIYVESEGVADGFVEDEWLGGMLEVGESVKIGGMKPALRCVMTTHPQTDLPEDPVILRTAAKNHSTNVGVFAAVAARGKVRIGDPVYLVK